MCLFAVTTYWACNHMKKQHSKDDRCNRSTKRGQLHIPIRPLVRFLDTSCRLCPDVALDADRLAEREAARQKIIEEAQKATDRAIDHHHQAIAERKLRRAVARCEWLKHEGCESCGSSMRAFRATGEPVCVARCHMLWKEEVKRADTARAAIKARDLETWEDVMRRYRGHGRSGGQDETLRHSRRNSRQHRHSRQARPSRQSRNSRDDRPARQAPYPSSTRHSRESPQANVPIVPETQLATSTEDAR